MSVALTAWSTAYGWLSPDVSVRTFASDRGKYLETFQNVPPRAEAASFTVSDAMEKTTATVVLARREAI
jgi:hypothetical protein